MANAFMPSGLSSLNAAGQDTLEQVMKQRLFEQQMQQAMLQGQGQLNNFRLDLRQQDAQERYRDDVIRQNELETQARLRIAGDKLRADEASAGAELQARQVVASLMAEGKYTEAEQVAMMAGITPPRRPERQRDPVQEAYDTTMARRRADADARKQGLIPTKAAKGPRDSAKLPEGVKAALRAKKGQAGWKTGVEALQTLEANGDRWWNALLGDHPDLDRNAVRAFIGNLYNDRLTPTSVEKASGDATALGPATMARIEELRKKKLGR